MFAIYFCFSDAGVEFSLPATKGLLGNVAQTGMFCLDGQMRAQMWLFDACRKTMWLFGFC